MNLSGLKAYFLSVMGISHFVLREKTACEYLLLLSPSEARPNPAMKALLGRLVEAIDWPQDATQKVSFDDLERETIKEKVKALSPKKVIMFGIEFTQSFGLKPKEQIYMLKLQENENAIPCAIVSSLNTLLKDKIAKRRAWELLQRF